MVGQTSEDNGADTVDKSVLWLFSTLNTMRTSERLQKVSSGHSNESRTVLLIKVQTKDAHGNIAARVIPSKDFWFESDPQFPSGEQTWNFVSSNWVAK
jgi:hypothetical protein